MKQTRYINIENDLNLYVETYGSSTDQACLFISGAGANSSFWSDELCMNLVKKRFYVIKYDHRDFGYSSKINWNEEPYDFIQLANDALTILNQLKIEKAHVIGHSMGGFIVQILAIHHPNRLISIASISSSTNSENIPPPPQKTWEIYLSCKPKGDLNTDLEGFMTVWKYLNGTASFDEELAIEYTQNLYKRQKIDGALGRSHVLAQETLTDRSEELTKIRIPSLVMHGEEDYAVDKLGAIETAKSILNSKLKIIPKMGHLPFNHDILKTFENEIIQFIILNRN